MNYFKRKLIKILNVILKKNTKSYSEFSFWAGRKKRLGELANGHYEYFYTFHFGLNKEFYSQKRVLDIGCGPAGSLEWADMTKERIGLDPLADSYLKLGTRKHKMKYIRGGSEKIPFPDNYFDVVCNFNSLDSVDNLNQTISEIIRVLKSEGVYLLFSDVNIEPTSCQPNSFSFNIVEKFKPWLIVMEEKHYEKMAGGTYESILENIEYDHKNLSKRWGIISVKFKKGKSKI